MKALHLESHANGELALNLSELAHVDDNPRVEDDLNFILSLHAFNSGVDVKSGKSFDYYLRERFMGAMLSCLTCLSEHRAKIIR